MKLTISLGIWASLLAGSSAFVVPQNAYRQPTIQLASSVAADQSPPLSPLTMWGERISDIRKLHEEMRKKELPEFAPEISAVKTLGLKRDDVDAQLQYVKDNAMEIKTMMQNHGAVIFRDFDLMKTQEGFQNFYAALGMKVCLDPLHSVSARPTVDGKKNSPVYEAVNKESRKNFFIGRENKGSGDDYSRDVRLTDIVLNSFTGMHNEFVGTRAPRAAAFVCFKAAETGGEFLVADGRRMFRDLDVDLVEELYNRQIRYSVMELPFFGWIDSLPGPLQNVAMGVTKGLVTAAINAKVDFDVEMLWGEGGYDNTKMLQARAPSQPPIVIHPITKDPTWFCNVHSHSSKLRKDRESMYVSRVCYS